MTNVEYRVERLDEQIRFARQRIAEVEQAMREREWRRKQFQLNAMVVAIWACSLVILALSVARIVSA